MATHHSQPISMNPLPNTIAVHEGTPERKAEEAAMTLEEWKPQKNELLIMISLSFISLMVALDATILVTVLPVRMNSYIMSPIFILINLSKLHGTSTAAQSKHSGPVPHTYSPLQSFSP